LRSEANDRVITVVPESGMPAGSQQPGAGLDSVTIRVFSVSGPNLRADDLAKLLRNTKALILPVSRDIELNRETSLDLSLLISELPELRELGLSIRRIEPQSVKVKVDTLQTREVPITASPLEGKFDITFIPDRVTVRGPARELAQLQEMQALGITGNIAQSQLRLVGTESLEIPSVTLSPPPGSRVIIVGQPTVKAVVKAPVTKIRRYTLPAVPFYVMTHSALNDRRPEISVTYNDRSITTMPTVEIEGPSAIIDRIEGRDTSLILKAFVELRSEDTALAGVERRVEFELPPGVTVVSPERTVKVTVKLTVKTP